MTIFNSILFLTSTSLMFLGGQQIANAEEIDEVIVSEENNDEITVIEEISSEVPEEDILKTFPLVISEDETLNFLTEEDKEFYIENVLNEKQPINVNASLSRASTPSQQFPGLSTTTQQMSTQMYKEKFVGYNSAVKDWAFANQYTLSKSYNYTFTTGYNYKGANVSLTVSRSVGITRTIPANSKKANRLGAQADVTVAYMKNTVKQNGKVKSTYYNYKTKTVDYFTHKVFYK